MQGEWPLTATLTSTPAGRMLSLLLLDVIGILWRLPSQLAHGFPILNGGRCSSPFGLEDFLLLSIGSWGDRNESSCLCVVDSDMVLIAFSHPG